MKTLDGVTTSESDMKTSNNQDDKALNFAQSDADLHLAESSSVYYSNSESDKIPSFFE